MSKYLLAYRGGGMAETDAEREAAMAAWGSWFGGLGQSVVDPGNPFGSSAIVGGGGNGAGATLTGYSVLSAESLAAARELAEGCPVLANGGSVEVYETIEVM
jgi:hypothetical protein